jgi:hypothetical protein
MQTGNANGKLRQSKSTLSASRSRSSSTVSHRKITSNTHLMLPVANRFPTKQTMIIVPAIPRHDQLSLASITLTAFIYYYNQEQILVMTT